MKIGRFPNRILPIKCFSAIRYQMEQSIKLLMKYETENTFGDEWKLHRNVNSKFSKYNNKSRCRKIYDVHFLSFLLYIYSARYFLNASFALNAKTMRRSSTIQSSELYLFNLLMQWFTRKFTKSTSSSVGVPVLALSLSLFPNWAILL